MDVKKKYYVQVSSGNINPAPTPDEPAEFEIEATYEEMLSVRRLLDARDYAGSRSAEYHFEAPFQESKTDKKKAEYEKNLEATYARLYELGTPETRKGIAEMEVVNTEDLKNQH